MMYKALYLGRFQVMHNGHLYIAKHIDQTEDIESIVFGIGSMQYNRNNKHPFLPKVLNPFTFEERKEMLEITLKEEIKKPYELIGIRDFHDCPKWAAHIADLTDAEIVYTTSPSEIKEFVKLGFGIRPTPVKDEFHAQIVREMIANDNGWRKYMPEGTRKWIEANNMDKVIADFYKVHSDEIEEVHKMQIERGEARYDPNKKY